MRDLGLVKSEIRLASSKAGIDELLRFVEEANKGKTVFQLFDYGNVINDNHLHAAYLNTLLSFHDGTNIASKSYIEMLLFVAMTKQISEAITIAGIKSPKSFVVFSNSRDALHRFGRIAKLARFGATRLHARKAAKRFGIGTGSINQGILMRMAVSRLDV
jgi:tRNA threonylcarbamoyladenosine modification (KEOPS) complex Cgi121 subunit